MATQEIHQMHIELRQLRYFVAVAEELHFGRAAQRLFLTQPALSQQIAKLEDELEVALLVRDQRNVSLTEAGKTLLEGVKRNLAQINETLESTRVAGGVIGTRLALGFVEYTNHPFIPPALQITRELHKNARVERHEMFPVQQIDALRSGQIDVGFGSDVGVNLDDASPIASRIVIDGQWQVLMPESHALASSESINVTDIAHQPLILFDRSLNPPLYDDLLRQLRLAGGRPNIVYETAQAGVGPRHVREGLGIMLIASYILNDLIPGIVQRTVFGFEPLHIRAYWRRTENSVVVLDFLSAVWNEVASRGKRIVS